MGAPSGGPVGPAIGRFRVWNKKPQRCFAGVMAGKADGGNGSPREPVPTDPLSSEEQSVVRPGRSPGLRGVNPAYSGASAAASHRLPYSPLRRAVEGAPGRANIQLSKWQMTLPEPRRRVNGTGRLLRHSHAGGNVDSHLKCNTLFQNVSAGVW